MGIKKIERSEARVERVRRLLAVSKAQGAIEEYNFGRLLKMGLIRREKGNG